jgi:hypothetical protein
MLIGVNTIHPVVSSQTVSLQDFNDPEGRWHYFEGVRAPELNLEPTPVWGEHLVAHSECEVSLLTFWHRSFTFEF